MADNAELNWVPSACKLPTADRPVRLAEFDDLFSESVRAAERIGPVRLRLTLTGGSDLESRVQDLAERETACCSFFMFNLTTAGPGEVILDVAVPPAHVDVLDAMAGRAGIAA